MIDPKPSEPFLLTFRGSFTAALRWHQFDALWGRLRERADAGWFLYAIGEPPPTQPATSSQVRAFLDQIDALLQPERRRPQCGIVYADDLQQPNLIKIYDPDHLGTACGAGTGAPLPGWTMSLLRPCDLPSSRPVAKQRRRWWRRLLD